MGLSNSPALRRRCCYRSSLRRGLADAARVRARFCLAIWPSMVRPPHPALRANFPLEGPSRGEGSWSPRRWARSTPSPLWGEGARRADEGRSRSSVEAQTDPNTSAGAVGPRIPSAVDGSAWTEARHRSETSSSSCTQARLQPVIEESRPGLDALGLLLLGGMVIMRTNRSFVSIRMSRGDKRYRKGTAILPV